MARLIKDASELDEIQEKLGITVDANSLSFANIVNAISVMQSKMGIAGATAAEAATTISGSLAMMKAAWSNLLVGISDDTADFDKLMDNMVNSATTALGNIAPRVKVALNGIGKLIKEAAPVIIEQIPDLAEELIPTAIDGLLSMINAAADALPDLISVLWDTLKNQGPELLEVAKDLTLELMRGLSEGLPDALPEIAKFIADLAEIITEPEFLTEFIESADAIMGAIADGMAEAVVVLLEKAPIIAENIIAAILQSIAAKFKDPKELVKSLGKNLAFGNNPATGLSLKVVESLLKRRTGGTDEDLEDIEGVEYPSDEMEWVVDMPDGVSGGTMSTTINGAEININVGSSNASAEEIAEAVSEALQQMTDRSLAAYG